MQILYEMFILKAWYIKYYYKCMLNADASLRTLNTNASGCFYVNNTLRLQSIKVSS